jgi:hypothetical protein
MCYATCPQYELQQCAKWLLAPFHGLACTWSPVHVYHGAEKGHAAAPITRPVKVCTGSQPPMHAFVRQDPPC